MKNAIQNTINTKIMTYVPGEFLPIIQDGELVNKSEFAAYKARRAARSLGRFIGRALDSATSSPAK